MPPHPSTQITEQDYLGWKHNPVSKVVLQYLADYRQALLRTVLERFEAGTLLEKEEQEIRGRCLTLKELTELPYASIESFYREDEPDNAAEAIEDRGRDV